MPKVVFEYSGEEITCDMGKVDRAKLYGYTRAVVEDEEGRECRLATLAADGNTLIGNGGTALATFSPDGSWRDKSELTPVGLDGEEVEAVASSLKAPIALGDEASVDDYLGCNIRMSYLLAAEGGFGEALEKALRAGTIYQFEFSYRGGISPDRGFLLADAGGDFWMMVGKPCEIEMVAPEATGAAVADPDDEVGDVGDELLDFGAI